MGQGRAAEQTHYCPGDGCRGIETGHHSQQAGDNPGQCQRSGKRKGQRWQRHPDHGSGVGSDHDSVVYSGVHTRHPVHDSVVYSDYDPRDDPRDDSRDDPPDDHNR